MEFHKLLDSIWTIFEFCPVLFSPIQTHTFGHKIRFKALVNEVL